MSTKRQRLTARQRIARGGGDYLTTNRLIEAEGIDERDRRELQRSALRYIDMDDSGPRVSVRELMREQGLL